MPPTAKLLRLDSTLLERWKNGENKRTLEKQVFSPDKSVQRIGEGSAV